MTAEPCIALREEGEGQSRFGGDGPPPADAPELTLIASIDLSELPRVEALPAEGTLRFYWNLEFHELERMDFVVASRVVYDPETTPQPASGTPLAGTLASGGDDFPHQLLGTSRDIQGPVLEEIPYWFTEGFPATRERYSEAELRGEGWTLLAQFASSRELMFGDMGDLYYVLPSADLQAQRFDRAMGIMQCT